MKDEIKEILQTMAKAEFRGVGLGLENKDLKILLDYITNLREEVEYKELWRLEYLKRNEKAIRTLQTLKGSARWERHLYEIDELLNILNGGDNK